LSNRKQDRRNPQVTKFVYVSIPDAKERLCRAVAILLRAGMKGRKQKRCDDRKKTRASQSHTRKHDTRPAPSLR
jgi:hypothetical protein